MSTNWLPKHREKKTAQSAALARAAGSVELDEAVRCPDYLAYHFLKDNPDLCPRSPEDGMRLARYREACIPGIYYYHVARTKHCDRLLQEEVRGGLEQFVLLGAGFDTRAYRFRSELRSARVFEVDLPALQQAKREALAELPQPPPGNIAYVSIDFNRETLADALCTHGFDRSRRTFFLWEGVTYYITAAAIESVLEFVAGTAQGNSLAFDYLLREVIDGHREYYGSSEHVEYVERIGEPFKFGIPEGAATRFLRPWGFDLVSEIGPRELETTYLIQSDGKLHGRVVGHLAIIHARVGRRTTG